MRSRRFASRLPDFSRLLLPLLAAVALVCLALSSTSVVAQGATDEEGCGCHSAENKAWQNSPHARAAQTAGELPAPTCEGCHGPYVRGHPDKGLMRLSADSAVCNECHSETFDQWEHTQHAQANVQCIGCHLSHSQTLRLTDEKLCLSCHRESLGDDFHVSHRFADVECTSCHVTPSSEPEIAVSVRSATGTAIQAPTHDFADVAAANCIECHSEAIRDGNTFGSGDRAVAELMTIANRVPELSASLKAAEQQNRVLATVSFVSLGLGIGMGAVMGMILVLFVGMVTQRKSR